MTNNEQKPLRKKVLNSLYWMGGLKYSGQIISWIVTIYVIRLLVPSDYGLMSLANTIVFFLVMLSELGLGAALVQTDNLSQKRVGQLFGLILICHISLSLILYFGGSFAAIFFSEPRLLNIFSVLSVTPLLVAFYIIPQSMLLRKMDFRTKSKIDFIATLCSSLMTLIMALNGFGVWSLVTGAITMHVASMIGYNFCCEKQVKPLFSFKGIGDLFSFGGYLTGGRFLWYFYSKADIFIGGKLLGVNSLGIYSTAMSLAAIPHEKVMPIINQVAFPAYSSIKSDIKLVRAVFLKSVRLDSFFIFPAFFGLSFVAPELIPWALGQKWIDAVIPMQLICMIMPFRALSTLFSPLLNGISRPDISFQNLAFAVFVMPLSFFIGVQYGVVGLCLAWIFGYSVVFIVMTQRSLKIIGILFSEFIICLRDPFIASLIMVGVLSAIKFLIKDHTSIFTALVVYVAVGATLFPILIGLINRKLINEFWGLLANNKS